ncbi:MAG: sugar kinase [Pseudopedobacter saltans]|uniref:Sugar kinase n=1 Tax=Pseudopedobacter saltans TaxID=151895 RepID=A0A2W5F086_9SPHI|nr:MAG: sugar kinase [Pseudopedobacter saltans]
MINKLTKNINLVFREIFKNENLSINDIAIKVNKSVSLITNAVMDMVTDGVVIEAGYAESRGGRKPTLYRLCPDVGYTIVLSMDQFISRVLVMDMSNSLLFEPQLFNIDLAKNDDIAKQILELLRNVIVESQLPKEKILGVGIAMPGFVDFVKGINYSFIPSPIKDVPLRNYLSKALELPVFIDNDSSTVALAESTFGLAKKVSNAMVVNISWGIGLGIITNGKLYRGENGFAGEFSHIPLFNNGKICSCGKIGCLETETSLKIVLAKVAEAVLAGRPTLLKKTFKEDDSLEEQFLKFIKAVEKRDTLAIELLNEAAYNIGKGIAVLIHIFNPKKIVLSGRGALAGNVWLPPIQQAINEHCIRRLSEDVEVVVSQMAYQAEWVGTAALVVDNTFSTDGYS